MCRVVDDLIPCIFFHSWRLDTNATCYSPLGELSTPELLVDELCELTSLNPSDISVHTIEELREQVFQKNSKGYHLVGKHTVNM